MGHDFQQRLMVSSNDGARALFSTLMQKQNITAEIDINLPYKLKKNGGYLAVVNYCLKGSRFLCELKIPNEEVLTRYTDVFGFVAALHHNDG